VSQGTRRLLAVVTLVFVFGGIAVVDRIVGRSPDAVAGVPAPAVAAARIAPEGVESAAWYCAGGTSAAAGATPTLLLVNDGSRPVAGTVTAVDAGGDRDSTGVVVPARASARVSPASMVSGSDVAASVVLDGGGVGVWQQIAGPAGWSVAPCASAPATHWYFAHGSTRSGDSLAIALYNPSATDAVASITLATSTNGVIAPAAYQGMSVPAGSLVVADVADHDQDDPAVATAVSTLSGSLVAAERQVSGQTGLSLLSGDAWPGTVTAFPVSTDPTGGGATFHLFNPSGSAVSVSAAVGLQHGTAAPIQLTVPAQGTAVLRGTSQTRIPADTPYSLVLSSQGPIAAARESDAPAGTAQPQTGISAGVAVGGDRWLLPAVPPPGTGAWYLAVVDLAGKPVTVTVRAPVGDGWRAVPGAAWNVTPGVPVVVGPKAPAPVGTEPLEIVASGPVAVELDAAPAGAAGVVVLPALALG